jgi:hypothetical protein
MPMPDYSFDYPPALYAVPLSARRSPQADAGGGGAILPRADWPGPAGTAIYQQPDEGYYDVLPNAPVDPTPERFSVLLRGGKVARVFWSN